MLTPANPSPMQATGSPIGRKPLSRWKMLLLIVLAGFSLFGVGWLTSQPQAPPEDYSRSGAAAPDKVGEIGTGFVPIPREMPAPVATPVAAPPPGLPVPNPVRNFPMAPAAPVRPVPIMGFQAQSGARTAAPSEPTGGGYQSRATPTGGDPLSDRLNAGQDMETSVATMLPNRHLFLTMGTPMPCITEQPIRTDVPGPFRCKVPSAVYSTSGAVALLDPGTWIVGQVREPLRRGTNRAFAVMTRLETPQGCLVKLRAPIGDQMGTAGIDGVVDTHFWERFQGFAMIALLDAAGQAAALGAARAIGGADGNGDLNFYNLQGMGQQLGQGSFGDDINIPPTLSTHEARNLVVMAMSDIDLRPCFKLRAVR